MDNSAFGRLVELARNLAEDVRDLDTAYVEETSRGSRDRTQALARIEVEFHETLRNINALTDTYYEA